MKVLHLIDSLGVGGAEAWLIELLRYWHRQGPIAPQNDFVATGGKPDVLDEEARTLGANIFYLRYSRSDLPAFTRAFRNILRNGRYTAIHDHQDYASGWHFLMGAGLLPPIRVTHVHNPAYQIRNNYGVTLSRRITANVGKLLVAHYATHITGTSRQSLVEWGFGASLYQAIPKGALHCGFDPARFLGDRSVARASVREEFGWPQDAKIILFAGRMDISAEIGHPQNHKNSGLAVSIAIACARRDARMCFIFAGSPSRAVPVLEQRVAEAGFFGRIVLTGIRKDIPRLMTASDVLFFPSRAEGLGMVAVEAQSAGLPVLASTTVPREAAVIPELVRFQSLDASEERWVEDLIQLADQPPTDHTAANARVAASAFSIDHSARALVNLYSSGLLG